MTNESTIRTRRLTVLGRVFLVASLCISQLIMASPVDGQIQVQTEAERVITISRGSTAVLTRPANDSITRITLADPAVADFEVFPPNELVVNAISVGSTSLVIWGENGIPSIYTVEVTADIASLQRQIDELFPQAGVSVTSTGTTGVVLTGVVRDPSIQRKVVELANTLGIAVVDNLQAPSPEQILLHVEFAEISKSVMSELGGDLIRVLNPATLDHAFDDDDTQQIETLSEGFVNILVEGDGSRLDAVIRLLKNTGDFKSLAEPNLVTREGQPASFLAGGEFPFPTLQSGNSDAVTIVFKEFGIRLNFTPTITNSGNIQLAVEPEVSSLDFANGLTFGGFQIPTILARRVQTDVELRPGQTLAIGGLLDNTIIKDVDKIPVLGDIPILGFFFRSESARQNRTELLVLVTPYVLDPENLPAPPLPTGEATDWDWNGHIRKWIEQRDSVGGGIVGAGAIPPGRTGGESLPGPAR